MIRRLGLIGVILALIGASLSIFHGRLLHMAFFFLAIAVILTIVGNAENDRNRSS